MSTETEQVTAGREMDADVAERVFGWTVERQSGNSPWLVKRGDARWDRIEGHPFSTNIAAAWQVVEEVQRRNPGWRFSLLGGDVSMGYHDGSPQRGVDENSREFFGWLAEFHGHIDPRLNYGDRHGEGHADTPALAICRAAIAAATTYPRGEES